MKWIKAAEVALDCDLSLLADYLNQERIAHRISEEQGAQVVWVADAALIEPLNTLLDKLQCGEVQLTVEDVGGDTVPRSAGLSPLATPATLLLIALSLLGFAAVTFGWKTLFDALIFLQPTADGKHLYHLAVTLEHGQIWRLITPAFLHFGILHVTFNSLWLWELGRRLELYHGRALYLLLVLVLAMAANLAQYSWDLLSGNAGSIFGGMSGVIYGLLGYIWIHQIIAPHPLFDLPKGLIVAMLVFLVVFMTGISEWLFGVGIANAAHLGGLLSGMCLAFGFGIVARKRAHTKF